MPEQQLRCHRCGSPDLILREVRLEIIEWQDGLCLTGDGQIAARGEAVFNQGDLQPGRTEIECADCGHTWHPRRRFVGAVE